MGKQSSIKSIFKYSRIDPQKNTRVVKIRDGTDDEELIGVRRVWGHPYRSKVKFHGSQEPVYYDIAIMELGMLIFQKIVTEVLQLNLIRIYPAICFFPSLHPLKK